MKPLSRIATHKRTVLSRRVLVALVLVVILVAVDVFSGGFVRAPLRSAVVFASSARIGFGDFVSSITASRSELEAENRLLREQLLRYQLSALTLDALLQENAHLREMSHLADSMRGGITVSVVSDGLSPYGTFLLGAGRDAGIHTGDIVFAPDGFVIGRVSDTQPKTALVSELFIAGASVPVTLSNAALTVKGRGGGNGTIEAPRALSIAEGASVTSPAFHGAPVGIVGRVESDPASAYKAVYLRTSVNLSALRFVYVLRP